MRQPIRVVYILSMPRSGSTLLGDTLGAPENYTHNGELVYFWTRPWWYPTRLCGCDRVLAECSFWSLVLAEVEPYLKQGGWWDAAEGRGVAPTHRSSIITLALKQVRENGVEGVDAEVASFIEAMEVMYRDILQRTGAEVIVDSSKLLDYAQLLALLPGFEVSFVHLIRDSRAVVFSRQKKLKQPTNGEKKSLSTPHLLKDMVDWVWVNRRIERFVRSQPRSARIRYEDFVADPVGSIATLSAEIGLAESIAMTPERSFELGPRHSYWGNRFRLQHGTITIREDQRWGREMMQRDKWLATVCSLPGLRQYGYL